MAKPDTKMDALLDELGKALVIHVFTRNSVFGLATRVNPVDICWFEILFLGHIHRLVPHVPPPDAVAYVPAKICRRATYRFAKPQFIGASACSSPTPGIALWLIQRSA